MTYDDLDQLIHRVDKVLNEVEALPKDDFKTLSEYYQVTFDFREMLRLQEVEYFRGHLERSLAAS